MIGWYVLARREAVDNTAAVLVMACDRHDMPSLKLAIMCAGDVVVDGGEKNEDR